MISRFLLSCSIISVLAGCKNPVEQSVDPGMEHRPPKQEVPKVATSTAAKLEIISDDVKRDDEKQTTTFTGNVDMRHPDFRLKCDHLVIHTNEEVVEPGVPFKLAIATGARVVVERTNAKGVMEMGVARKVVFDPQTGDIVLSGGRPTLVSGGMVIKTDSSNAIIVLRKDGSHSVIDKYVQSIPSIPKRRMITLDTTAPRTLPGAINLLYQYPLIVSKTQP